MPIPFVFVKNEVDCENSTPLADGDNEKIRDVPNSTDVANVNASLAETNVKDDATVEQPNTAPHIGRAKPPAAGTSSAAQIIHHSELNFDGEFSGEMAFSSVEIPSNTNNFLGRIYALENMKLFIPDNIIKASKQRSTTADTNEGISFLTILLIHFVRGKHGDLSTERVNPVVYRFIKFLYGNRLKKLTSTNLEDPATDAVFQKLSAQAFKNAQAIRKKITK